MTGISDSQKKVKCPINICEHIELYQQLMKYSVRYYAVRMAKMDKNVKSHAGKVGKILVVV